MVQDFSQSDVLSLTQEFLGMMLGSRRTTVSAAVGSLQARSLIDYQRGRIKIIDRPQLEKLDYGCYQIAKDLYIGVYSKSSRGERG